jgi:hypothetical protein
MPGCPARHLCASLKPLRDGFSADRGCARNRLLCVMRIEHAGFLSFPMIDQPRPFRENSFNFPSGTNIRNCGHGSLFSLVPKIEARTRLLCRSYRLGVWAKPPRKLGSRPALAANLVNRMASRGQVVRRCSRRLRPPRGPNPSSWFEPLGVSGTFSHHISVSVGLAIMAC